MLFHPFLAASSIGALDWSIIIFYLIAIVGIGVAAGFMRKKGGEGGHYFLADNSLKWPVIGLAMFAANISTVHLVSLAESAYKYGLVFGNFEWMAGSTLILLSLFFAPLYLRSRVATLPDFLERRFNRHCRDWLAFISIVSAIVIHIGVALFTAAWVLRGIMGIAPEATIMGINALLFFIIVLGVLTGIYTMIGGLLAVVWTESVQTVLLLVGAVCITAYGYIKIGGWHNMTQVLASHPHPLAHAKEAVTWSTANFLSMSRTAGDASGLPWHQALLGYLTGNLPNKDPSGMSWYAMLLGYPVIGIWYWCCDQTIVQRVLAAKDEKNARLGPLFCAFIKILPVFLFVLPGTICLALVQSGYFGAEAPENSKDSYVFMITHMLPIGLKGLVTAAMLAAAMQTCSAALNSTATLFAYDIVKRWRPATTDHSLVVIGKITTVVATVVAIAASPAFGHYDTIFEGLSRMICYMAPPITTVFLLGVFWKKASARAAYITLVSGAVLGVIIFILDWCSKGSTTEFPIEFLRPIMGWYKTGTGWNVNFMLMAFYLFLLGCLTMWVFSLVYPEELKEEAKPLVWENWLEPLRGTAGGHGLANYKVLSAVVCATFVALYIIFR